MSLLLKIWKFIGRWPSLQQFFLFFIVPKFLVGIVAVLLDEQNRVVLFHHTYRRKYAWSLPGGWLKRGEDPAEALQREIREEAGLSVEVLRPLAAIARSVAPNFEVIYLAKWRGGQFVPSAEVDRIEAFTLDRLPELKPYQRKFIEDVFT